MIYDPAQFVAMGNTKLIDATKAVQFMLLSLDRTKVAFSLRRMAFPAVAPRSMKLINLWSFADTAMKKMCWQNDSILILLCDG